MNLLACTLILSSVIGVYSDHNSESCCKHIKCGDGVPLEQKLKPARKGDTVAFQGLVKSFLTAVVEGLPGQNVPSLDPLKIPYLKIYLNDRRVCFTFRDLVIRNLTHVDIRHSILDTKENFTQIQMNLNLTMKARIGIVIEGKKYSRGEGNINLRLQTNGLPCTTRYGYAVTRNEEGISYFSVLDDISKCKYDCDYASLDFRPRLNRVFTGADFKKCDVPFDIEDQAWRNELSIKIVLLVLGKLIDNFRVGCQVLPAYKYIPDIDCP